VAPFLQLVELRAAQEYLGVKSSIPKEIELAIALLIVGVSFGCGQRPQFAAASSPFQDRNLPFHSESGSKRRSNDLAQSLADIASGTTVSVRLQSSLSSAHAVAGDSFQAVLDAPLIWKGQTIAPRGSLLYGKVLEAKPSEPAREAGYLRLALSGITLDGKIYPLQTASIFVKGATYEREAEILPLRLASSSKTLVPVTSIRPQTIAVRDDAAIPTARLLTFHLAQPVTVANRRQ
jgi:hypothetical protein